MAVSQGQSSNAVMDRCVGGGSSISGVPRENLSSSSQSVAVKEKRVEGDVPETNRVEGEVPKTNNNQGASNTNKSDDVESTNNINDASNDQPQNPPSTLVQTVGNRSFKVTRMMVAQQMMLVLSFPRGLTLLTPDSDSNQPTENGVAQLDVHRKFLPSFNKYLHWISFTFTTGHKVQAQIMLPTRLSAACQLVQGGASACFLHCPFRVQRRPQVPTRRRRINGRK